MGLCTVVCPGLGLATLSEAWRKTSIYEKRHVKVIMLYIPSRELTYPPKNGIFEDYFPFPQVGYVNFLKGIHIYGMEVSHYCYKSQNVFIAKNGVFLC